MSFDAIRLFLTYAAEHDYELNTVDVRTAYLNAELEPGLDLWMKQPRGFEQSGPNGEPMVCKLNKAIYGLKQGARRWILTLKAGLKRMGLKCSESDQGVFVIRRGEAELIMLTYVDDIMMADNCETLRRDIMSGIQAKWETTDMTELEWCLGIKIETDPSKHMIYMSQSLYIKDTVKKFFPEGLAAGVRPTTPCADDIIKLTKGDPDSALMAERSDAEVSHE